MNICIIGLGYVGVVSAACFADMKHKVLGIDIEKRKVDLLNEGKSPIMEPGLSELVKKNVDEGRLKGDMEFSEYIHEIDTFIICVGTPSKLNGDVNLEATEKVSQKLSDTLSKSKKRFNLIFRSTVPPGTMDCLVEKYFSTQKNLRIAYHPEFLREGSALFDFYDNPQIVASNVKNYRPNDLSLLFKDLYKKIDYRFYNTEVKASEAIKYFNNTFHALKVAFANEIGRFCHESGINTSQVMKIFLEDEKLNISTAYLNPGFAFGGSCLPKDVKALNYMARHSDIDLPLIKNITKSNDVHIEKAYSLIVQNKFKKIGFNGLTFKENTDDVRESPYVRLVERLIGKGYDVKIFDRYINTNLLMGKNLEYLNNHIPHITERMVDSEEKLFEDIDVIVVSHNFTNKHTVNSPIIYLSNSFQNEHDEFLTII